MDVHKRGQALSGVLVLDKPHGETSFGVVRRIRRAAGVKKVGHTGTLDPMATGVLPVCLGQATKLAPYLMGGCKEYIGDMLLGVVTDTCDITGQIVERIDGFSFTDDKIRQAAAAFRGRITQTPPAFSAVKIDGRPAYKLARKGETVVVKPREVDIYQLEITDVDLPTVSFRARVSKGTYIRSLALDIGRKLGVGACLSRLRRTEAVPFSLEQALAVEEAENMAREGRLGNCLIEVNTALSFLPELRVSEEQARYVAHGRSIPLPRIDGQRFHSGPVRIVHEENGLLAIYEHNKPAGAEDGCLTPLRVLAGN